MSPDAHVYLVALFLALASGFLFGAVPVRQILRTNPYEVVKAGSSGIIAGHTGRRITLKDVLLVVQIAICAVLVTSSLVAIRGLVRSLHSNFGFDPENAMVVDTSLSMAGYSGERVPAMQRRMIDTLASIHGVKVCGTRESDSSGRRRVVRGYFHRPNDRFKALKCCRRRRSVQNISRILSCGRHRFAGGQGALMAGRQRLAARGCDQRAVCAKDLRIDPQRAGQVLQARATEPGFRWWVLLKMENIIN